MSRYQQRPKRKFQCHSNVVQEQQFHDLILHCFYSALHTETPNGIPVAFLDKNKSSIGAFGNCNAERTTCLRPGHNTRDTSWNHTILQDRLRTETSNDNLEQIGIFRNQNVFYWEQIRILMKTSLRISKLYCLCSWLLEKAASTTVSGARSSDTAANFLAKTIL